jgi:RNA polymerase sigma-54 factor
MKLRQSVETKLKLSTTLRNWLPVLMANVGDLEETLQPFMETNPLVEMKSGFEKSYQKEFNPKKLFKDEHNSNGGVLEALIIDHKSLYDEIDEQIEPPLFPTPLSSSIAYAILENINEEGYFEGEFEPIADQLNVSVEEVGRVHQRFMYIEPFGIGARNVKENFLFQLSSLHIDDELYNLTQTMIEHLEHIEEYANKPRYVEAIKTIQLFKNPPAIEYLEEDRTVIPDIMIYTNDEGQIDIELNDKFYPTISIDGEYSVEHKFLKDKLQEAKDLVDSLEMRKATLYKVGLMLIEYQYDYFFGGDMKPLTLQMLADEFGHNPSTISRAISNKYIACDRGIIPMKAFFTAPAIAKSEDKEDEISNSAIKSYMQEVIKEENKKKPLSDEKLLKIIKEKFDVDIGRRTIAKYRYALNIGSSSERKKLYKMAGFVG